VVIDPGEITEEMYEQLTRIGPQRVKYILLTHCHFDHILGADELRRFTGAPIAIHKSEERAMQDSRLNGMAIFGIPSQRLCKPDILFWDEDTFEVGDLTFRVMYTPGHSAGSSCFVCDDVIFTGDTLFRDSVGRTDLPTGSYQTLLKSLKKFLQLPKDYVLYPGHGNRTTLSYERENNPYMIEAK